MAMWSLQTWFFHSDNFQWNIKACKFKFERPKNWDNWHIDMDAPMVAICLMPQNPIQITSNNKLVQHDVGSLRLGLIRIPWNKWQ